MQDKEVKIEEMTLRVPGMNEMEAHSLVMDVADHLSDGIPGQKNIRRREELNVRVTIPQGLSHKELAHFITAAILKDLE
jgi:hypothetical protein